MPATVRRSPSKGFAESGFKYTPLEHVRTLLINFVQGLFSAAPAGDFHWTSDIEQTEIIIRDENPIHVETYGQRPCINFTMGQTSFYSLGMDDFLFYDFDISRKTKGILVPGVTNINVSSRVDIEAHNLAWVIAEHIWLLREVLLKEGFFEIGRGINISPPSPPGSIIASDSSDEWTCSTISVPWQFARKSAFTPLGQTIVKNIIGNINPGAAQSATPMGWPAAPGAEMPINVNVAPAPPYYGQDTSNLPKQAHPTDPARIVTVRAVRPYQNGLNGPSMNGRPLPIT